MHSILLRNGLKFDTEGGSVENTDILIENGKIKEVSKEIFYESQYLDSIDLKESCVLPGVIDCHTYLGIIEEATGKIGIDNNEISEPVTPELRGIDAINPMDIAFKDAVSAGITSVMSGPIMLYAVKALP